MMNDEFSNNRWSVLQDSSFIFHHSSLFWWVLDKKLSNMRQFYPWKAFFLHADNFLSILPFLYLLFINNYHPLPVDRFIYSFLCFVFCGSIVINISAHFGIIFSNRMASRHNGSLHSDMVNIQITEIGRASCRERV